MSIINGILSYLEPEYITKYFGFDKGLAPYSLGVNYNIVNCIPDKGAHQHESHFLFVPTRAECYGIVFSEASAYGLISITTHTGGVPSIINGINGYTLPLESKANEYYTVIKNLLDDKKKLALMSKSSREFYDTTLAWNNFGTTFSKVCSEIVKK